MCTELPVQREVRTLPEQVQVEVAQHLSIPIRIVHLDDVTVGEGETKAVIKFSGFARFAGFYRDFEHAAVAAPGHRAQFAGRHQPQFDGFGCRVEGPHDGTAAARGGVRTEHRERIAVEAADEGRQRFSDWVTNCAGHLVI
jgi:hypothetical protein